MTRQTLLQLRISPLDIQNYVDTIRLEHYSPLKEGSPEKLAESMRSLSGMIELNWTKLPEGSRLADKSIAETGIRSVTGVSIAGIMRDNQKPVTNPPSDFVLRSGDILALIGTSEQYRNFESFCGAELAASPAAAERTGDGKQS